MKMAIIGFGGMGTNHFKYIVKRLNESDFNEKVEVKGIYDIDPERCEYAVEHGLKSYASAQEIYDDAEVELVLVATPNDLHCGYVEAAVAAGKNVIVEKPAAMDTPEVIRMYDAAEKAGVKFSPHQNRRWDDDFLSMKAIYDSGKLGRVYRIESRVMGSNGIPGAWRKVERQGGGMMLDWGVHLIDQMLLMVDSTITSVHCNYSYELGEEVDDGFDLEVKFENGILYRVVVDTNSFIELPRWEMYGIDGTAACTEWRHKTVEGDVVTCKIRHDDQLQGVNAGNGLTKTMAARRTETVDRVPLEHVFADKDTFYKDFVTAVRTGSPTTVTKAQVLRVFDVMETAKLSAKENRVIEKRI